MVVGASTISNGMDTKTIQHIAKLARIRLSDKEESHIKNDLSSVLDYIGQLNKVNTENTEPLYQTTGLVNSVREDNDSYGWDYGDSASKESKKNETISRRLLEQAPDRQDRFVKVKSVLNK